MLGHLAGTEHCPAKGARGAAGPTCRKPKCPCPLFKAVSVKEQPETQRGSSIPAGFLYQPPHQAPTSPQFFPAVCCQQVPQHFRVFQMGGCSHGGEQGPSLVLLSQGWPGARGHCLCLPQSPRLRQGLLWVPQPPQLWLRNRAGAGLGKEVLPSSLTAHTAHTSHAPGTGSVPSWSCRYLPSLLLKTCPRG